MAGHIFSSIINYGIINSHRQKEQAGEYKSSRSREINSDIAQLKVNIESNLRIVNSMRGRES